MKFVIILLNDQTGNNPETTNSPLSPVGRDYGCDYNRLSQIATVKLKEK